MKIIDIVFDNIYGTLLFRVSFLLVFVSLCDEMNPFIQIRIPPLMLLFVFCRKDGESQMKYGFPM